MDLKQIKPIRKSRKIKLNTLQELTGISTRTLGLIENGNANPSIDSLERIAKALGFQIGIVFV